MTPGIHTSEFKAALLTVIVSVIAAAADWVSNKWGFAGGISAVIGYVLSRGLAKNEQRGTTTTGN